jgi:LAO/AO transport system kinase
VSPGRAREPGPLLDAARTGDRAALARLLSLVEQGGADARAVGRLSYPLGGQAYTVGLTGAPGAGKSTLTSALIGHLRARALPVAVLAIDPTSPFSGGAILGDRVRMQDHATDPGVFIRSMATRGQLGGLALAVPEAIRLLDAVGKPWIIVETVGVGQVEVEIARQADTTVVVVNPGWGDGVQANKAGLMEIADVFVINKADREGVERTARDLEMMLSLGEHGAWLPPVLKTVAARDEGIENVLAEVARHREHLIATGEMEKRRVSHLRLRVETILKERVVAAADRIRDDFGAAIIINLLPFAAPHSVILADRSTRYMG